MTRQFSLATPQSPLRQYASVKRPTAVILIHRRLDNLRSGSGSYLLALIERLHAAGFDIRIVVAPVTGFGSIPLSRPAQADIIGRCDIVWPGNLRIGPVFVATSAAVWRRAIRRGAALAFWRLFRHRHARPQMRSSLAQSPVASECARIVEAVNESPATLVVAEYSSLAPILPRCQAQVRAVLLHDLFALRAQSFRKACLPPDHEDLSLKAELERIDNADLCLYASLTESRVIAQHLPDKRHIWMPPRLHPRAVPPSGAPRAVFLGVRHGGNLDSLAFILDRVWPTVHQRAPEAELWIVGEIGNDMVAPPDGVRVIKTSNDLDMIGGADSIGLAPVRAASGISIKIATYLELGMSVLASPKAVEGYGGRLDDIVVKATEPEEFQDRLTELLLNTELRRETARRGAELARDRISDASLDRYLADLTN